MTKKTRVKKHTRKKPNGGTTTVKSHLRTLKYKPMRPKKMKKGQKVPEGWYIERKFDGTRTLLQKEGNQHRYVNRANNDKTALYPELNDEPKKLRADQAILDGEVVQFKDGEDSFRGLAKRDHLKNPEEIKDPKKRKEKEKQIKKRTKKYPLTYVPFDILEKDNQPLIKKPLEERKKILEETVPDNLKHIKEKGFTLDQDEVGKLKKKDREGIVTKDPNSKYEKGKSDSWLKKKFKQMNDVVIIGYTKGKGERKGKIGALKTAIYDNGNLKSVGKVGTGMDEEELSKLKRKIDKGEKPIARVEFDEYTKDKMMRAPSFISLRKDIKPKKTHY